MFYDYERRLSGINDEMLFLKVKLISFYCLQNMYKIRLRRNNLQSYLFVRIRKQIWYLSKIDCLQEITVDDEPNSTFSRLIDYSDFFWLSQF